MSESADDVQIDSDDESDTVNGQLEDTVSGGASDTPDSSIADHSQRQRRPPQRYGEWVTPVARGRGTTAFALTVAEDIVHDDEPSTYREAVCSPQAASWVQAMSEEMESLHKNDTWDLVLPPKGRKIVGVIGCLSSKMLLQMLLLQLVDSWKRHPLQVELLQMVVQRQSE